MEAYAPPLSGAAAQSRKVWDALFRSLAIERNLWGTTPQTQLQWILDRVVYADDLETPSARAHRFYALVDWIHAQTHDLWDAGGAEYDKAIADARAFTQLVQEPLRTTLAALFDADGTPHLKVLTGEFAGQVSATLLLRHDTGRYFCVERISTSLVAAARVALFEAIARVPQSLLRRCRMTGCGHLFVARKTQRHCSRHREAARREQFRKAQKKRRARLKAEARTRRKAR